MNETDFLANAREGWGETPPDWIVRLAEECRAASASVVAKRLDYSVAVISGAVRNTYKGAMPKLEAKVRGAFMGAVVDCPVLGEVERDRCEQEQGRRFYGTSANRARLYRACRAGCPQSRLKGGNDG